MTAEEEQTLRKEAAARVRKRRDFGGHCVVYVIVNSVFVAIWAMTGGYFWPAWVMGIWGIGLLLNAWDVYFRKPVTQSDIEREMERLRR